MLFGISHGGDPDISKRRDVVNGVQIYQTELQAMEVVRLGMYHQSSSPPAFNEMEELKLNRTSP